MTENEMVGWHHQLVGQEFEQTPGVGDGQGGLACCNSRWEYRRLAEVPSGNAVCQVFLSSS